MLLSLTQLVCWLFLEMAATGSDLVVIGWLFALATTASTLGLRRHDPVLTCVGGTAYLLFATSRLPLLVVTAASRGGAARRVRGPGLAGRRAGAAGGDGALPRHLGGRAGRGSGPGTWRASRSASSATSATAGTSWLLPVAAVTVGASAVVVLRHGGVAVLRRHHGWAHLLAVTAPMAAVALWDLERKGFAPAAWEGLHYLYLAVPTLLVVVAQHRGAEAQSAFVGEPCGRKGWTWRAPLPPGPRHRQRPRAVG